MKTHHQFCMVLKPFLIILLLCMLPGSNAFAQLTKEDGLWDGITVPPHDRPLNLYGPCSKCHIASNQWAEAKFEIKKPTITTREDYVALRKFQYQTAKAMARRCSGSCGHPINYQIHPVRNQACTLCHDKYLEHHSGTEMVIWEKHPERSCQTGGCHDKGLEKVFEKIPFWSMSFVELEQDDAMEALNDLLVRTQAAANSTLTNPDIDPDILEKAEVKWKHEIKNRLDYLVHDDLMQVSKELELNLKAFVTNAEFGDMDGTLEGKVEAKSEESNKEVSRYMWEFFNGNLRYLDELIQETKFEIKYKPAMPADVRSLVIDRVERYFPKAKSKDNKPDKLSWTLDDAEIKVEFKGEETKFKFTNFPRKPNKGFDLALRVMADIEKAYPDAILSESKFAHSYAGEGDDRWLISDIMGDYKATLPDKEVKFEFSAKKDTTSVPDVASLLPLKVESYDDETIVKLKTEIKIKLDKGELEIKAEVAIAEDED